MIMATARTIPSDSARTIPQTASIAVQAHMMNTVNSWVNPAGQKAVMDVAFVWRIDGLMCPGAPYYGRGGVHDWHACGNWAPAARLLA